ncbi:MAG: HAD family hydrolase [Candidatus Kariarchaeaceae archaeon]
MDSNKKELTLDLSEIDTLIFDFDGTIFDGTSLSLPIFRDCFTDLLEQYQHKMNLPSDQEILSQFGKQQNDIYLDLLQNATPEMVNTFAECVEDSEVINLRNGIGILYEGALDVLQSLKDKGYKLALCTNARKDYLEAITERFNLNNYFSTLYAAGLFEGKDKIWMVQQILKELNTEKFAYVGDRIHDIEAARVNHGISIGCAYGFGIEEVKEANIVITDFRELLNLL